MAPKKSAILSVKIVADAKRFAAGMKAAEKTVGRFQRSMTKVGKIGAVATTLGVVSAAALAGASNLAALSASIIAVAGAALALPGLFAGFAVGLGVMAAALKDLPEVLGDLAPKFGSLQDAISARFWSGAEKPIRNLVSKLLPTLQTGLSGVATELGNFFASMANALSTPLSVAIFSNLFDYTAEAIDRASEGIASFIDAVMILINAGSSYLPGLATAFNIISEKFLDFITQIAGDGRLHAWIQGGIDGLKLIGSVAGSLIGILVGIGTAATNAGGAGLGELATGLGRISDIVNGPAFQGALTTIFKGAHGAMEGLFSALGPIGDMFVEIAPTLATFLDFAGRIAGSALSILAPALGILVSAAEPLVEAIGGGLMTVLEQLGTWFTDNQDLITTFATELGEGLSGAVEMIMPMVTGIITALTNMATFIMDNGTAFTTLAVAVAGGVAAFKILQGAMTAYKVVALLVKTAQLGITTAMAAYRAGLTVSTAVQAGFNAVMAANPIALVVIAIAALVAGLVWFFTQTKAGQAAWKAFTKFVTEATTNVVNWFKSAWTTAQAMFKAVVAVIKAVFQAQMKIIQTVASAVVNAIVGFFKNMQARASAVINAVKGFFQTGFNAARSIVSNVIAGITGFINRLRSVASGVMSAVRGFFQTGFNAAKTAVSNAISGMKSIVQGIRDKVSAVVGGIKGKFSSAFNGAKSVVSNAVSGITGTIDRIAGAVRNAIGFVRDLFNNFKPPAWLGKITGLGGTGFDLPAMGFNMPVTAASGIGSTGGISVAKMFDQGNEPRRTNKAAEQGDSRPPINQYIYPQPGQSEEQIGQSAARELMFRYDYR